MHTDAMRNACRWKGYELRVGKKPRKDQEWIDDAKGDWVRAHDCILPMIVC